MGAERGRAIAAFAAVNLGGNKLLMFKSGRVVAIVLPPNSASIPVALVVLQDNVTGSSSSSGDIVFSKRFAGRQLLEVQEEAHVLDRAEGSCRVAGANISRAVGMTKMYYTSTSGDMTVFVLEANE
ncbi:hypothetical protein OEZ86_006998 [Tetradesmus obliquus]|nr:hypothetical protein OEZ86_006998 [Tetradesmus obliquus]